MYRLSIIYVVCGKYNFLCYEVCACVRVSACLCACECVYACIAGTPACMYCVISICMCV